MNALALHVADDGAVVYLDGVEVHRLNCCETPEDDYLSLTGSGGNEGLFSTILLETDLPAGDHLFAVSVHQSATDSSTATPRTVTGMPEASSLKM